jgi:hypothetical protein
MPLSIAEISPRAMSERVMPAQRNCGSSIFAPDIRIIAETLPTRPRYTENHQESCEMSLQDSDNHPSILKRPLFTKAWLPGQSAPIVSRRLVPRR